jgi:hypothetical protein
MTNMQSKKPSSIKGVCEHPADSGVCWICYYVEGKRHRKKVGRHSDTIALYQRRKTYARMGIKMPEIRPRRAVLFEEIAEDALAYSKEHKASYPGDRSTGLPNTGRNRKRRNAKRQQCGHSPLPERTKLQKLFAPNV